MSPLFKSINHEIPEYLFPINKCSTVSKNLHHLHTKLGQSVGKLCVHLVNNSQIIISPYIFFIFPFQILFCLHSFSTLQFCCPQVTLWSVDRIIIIKNINRFLPVILQTY